MKKSLAALALAASVALTGCFGSFGLTKNVYSAANGISNVVVKEAVFLVGVMPVGGFCIFADWLVFNTMEYWLGTNPVASSTFHQRDENGNQVIAVKMPDGSLFVKLQSSDGQQKEMILQQDAEVLRILDANGKLQSEHAYAE